MWKGVPGAAAEGRDVAPYPGHTTVGGAPDGGARKGRAPPGPGWRRTGPEVSQSFVKRAGLNFLQDGAKIMVVLAAQLDIVGQWLAVHALGLGDLAGPAGKAD